MSRHYLTKKEREHTVYAIRRHDDRLTVEPIQYGDLCREYAAEAPTPQGVEPIHHLRGTQLWTWGATGNDPRLLDDHDTQEEAEDALYKAWEAEMEVDDAAADWYCDHADADITSPPS